MFVLAEVEEKIHGLKEFLDNVQVRIDGDI